MQETTVYGDRNTDPSKAWAMSFDKIEFTHIKAEIINGKEIRFRKET